MLVRLVVPLFAMLASACSPGVCGEVSIGDVQPNPDIEKYRRSDGRIGLIEFCGITYGASSTARVDLGLTTLVLDQNVMEDVTGGPISPIPRVVLPAAFVVFWSANLVAGKTLTLAQLAGTGLHKSSEGLTYETYRLTAATLTVLEGPLDRREEKDIDIVSWSETWRLRWSFEFGNGAQRWQGEDVVERTKDLEVGSPGQLPPDAKP
ncbi:MAG: hypothetical protein Q8N26_31540 [Myxococcales bacterium]|nr:hypothetical protein [Myxococcales bacterium]